MRTTRPGGRSRSLWIRTAVVVLAATSWAVAGAGVLGAVPAAARVSEGGGDPGAWADRMSPVRLRWPADAVVLHPWDPPGSPYAAGHRGVDLAVAPGARVVAMGDGVVGWAGVVAGTAWVSIDHAGGIRTTVGPMATIAVVVGRPVIAGAVLGTATGRAHATPSGFLPGLHVSARRDGVYIDPASLVGDLVPTLLPPGDVRLGP